MKLRGDLVVVLVLLVVGVLPGGGGQGEVLQPDVVLVVLGVGLPVLALVPFIKTLLYFDLNFTLCVRLFAQNNWKPLQRGFN